MAMERIPKPRGKRVGHSAVWACLSLILLLTSCATQSSFQYVHQPVGQSVRELDVQAQEVRNRVPWPEKVASSVGVWSPCPEQELDEDGAVFEMDMALDGPFEVLERGAGQEAILEEWRQQMSGVVREDPNVEWGNLMAADGVVVLDVTCVGDVQRHSVTISDVASGRRAFMRSYAGGDVFDAMYLLGLELDQQYTLERHPLDGLSEAELRASEFDLFEVDEISAMSWRNELEDVVEKSIRDWRPMKRVSLLSSVKAELTLHPREGSRTRLSVRGGRGAAIERHLNASLSGLSLPAIPMFGGVPLRTTATLTWPFSYSYDPAFLFNHRRRYRTMPELEPWLKDAPNGRYEFEMSFWQLGEVEEKNIRLRHGQTRGVETALLMSLLIPGSGLSYVTYKEERGSPYLLGVAALSALGWFCWNRAESASTEIASEEWRERSFYSWLGGALVYGSGVYRTYEEALRREEAMEAFLKEKASRD